MSIDPTLAAHIGAGSVGFLSGGAALIARKGERVHRAAGAVFVAAMLTMAASAAYLSLLRQPGTFISSIFTFYLMATAWLAAHRKDGRAGPFEKAGFVVVLACLGGDVFSAMQASASPTGRYLGYSVPVYGMAVLFAAIAAAFDLKFIRRGAQGVQRIARHLWRMCLGFFFAAASSATQLQKVLPKAVMGVSTGSILLAIALAPLAALFFWIIRVRFTNWFKPDIAAQQAA